MNRFLVWGRMVSRERPKGFMECRPRDIVIVSARCSGTTGGFGIRFERSAEAQWSATWTFALKEGVATREGYDQSEITGTIRLDSSYPGCPHCAKASIVRCGRCGRVACWDGEARVVTCPWCKNRELIGGQITSLLSRNDA